MKVPKTPKTKVVSLRLLPALLAKIDADADAHAIESVDRSGIIRDILEAYYAQAV